MQICHGIWNDEIEKRSIYGDYQPLQRERLRRLDKISGCEKSEVDAVCDERRILISRWIWRTCGERAGEMHLRETAFPYIHPINF